MPPIDIDFAQRCIASTGRSSGGIRPYLLTCLMLFAALIGAEFAGAAIPEPIGNALPWGLVLLLAVGGAVVRRRRARTSAAISRAWDCTHLEDYPGAWEAVSPVLPGPIDSRIQRGQVLVVLAVLAEQQGEHRVAIQLYETILEEGAGDGLLLQQSQIALAKQKIHAEELSDAVRMIDRMLRIPMPPMLRALVDLVELQRQVFMGQAADAVEGLEERRESFRKHLSTRAGYGYALLAAALHFLGRATEAGRMWRDATLLVDRERLLREFAVLQPVVESYPASERPE